MKSLIALSLLFSVVSASAVEKEGTFEVVRPAFMRGYDSKACKTDGGVYLGDGLCKFENGGGATAEVKATAEDKDSFLISLSSVGTNAHMCDFSGKATRVSDYHLLSLNNGDEGKCEVSVFYTSPETIAIKTNGECSEFCGANMMLDEENLTRVK